MFLSITGMQKAGSSFSFAALLPAFLYSFLFYGILYVLLLCHSETEEWKG